MICKNCFNMIPDGSVFCSFCGQAIPEPVSVSAAIEKPFVTGSESAATAQVNEVSPAVTSFNQPLDIPNQETIKYNIPPAPSFSTPNQIIAPSNSQITSPIVSPLVTSSPIVTAASASTAASSPVISPNSSPEVFPSSNSIPTTNEKRHKHLNAWGYVLTDIALAIPLFNIIIFFVWCFSHNTNKDRQSYVRSRFIWFAIGLVLSILLCLCIFAFAPSFFTSFQSANPESSEMFDSFAKSFDNFFKFN